MQTKRITLEEVYEKFAANRDAGTKAMHALAMAGIKSGSTQASFDTKRPFVLWTRFRPEVANEGNAEIGWGIHPDLRFSTPAGAARAAEDLMKLDKTLEIRIECQVPPCAPVSTKSPPATS